MKIVPFKEYETEITVVNSRFIASISPAHTVDEARTFIKSVKERYADASHHVPAFVIGHGKSVTTYCSDDGEPSGTAGRPALAVLQGSGLGDVVVVITRYFGGTKLGTGGLVRAYGDAVRAVLDVTKRAEIVKTNLFILEIDYPYYERAKRILLQGKVDILQEEFTEIVTIEAKILTSDFESLIARVIDLTSNQATFHLVQENLDTYRLTE